MNQHLGSLLIFGSSLSRLPAIVIDEVGKIKTRRELHLIAQTLHLLEDLLYPLTTTSTSKQSPSATACVGLGLTSPVAVAGSTILDGTIEKVETKEDGTVPDNAVIKLRGTNSPYF